MAQLAIKGHETRGREVIELLEMLGGNKKMLSSAIIGDVLNPRVYFFDSDSLNNRIVWYYLLGLEADRRASEMMIFTLEEFEQKFPYKVGDKVKNARINDFVGEIVNARWDDNENQIIYEVEWDDTTKSTLTYFARGLQPYKEETMEESDNKDIFEGNTQSCDIMNDIIKKDMEEKGDKAKAPNLVGEDYSGKRFGYKIPQGYEVDCIQDNEIIIKPIKPKYPKTYYECCEVLGIDIQFCMKYLPHGTISYKDKIIYNLQELIICRAAYWKIAGEQMGLGEPWEPNWSTDLSKYYISFYNYKVDKGVINYSNKILVFPTEKMRNTFYDNFKDLIESCKELL